MIMIASNKTPSVNPLFKIVGWIYFSYIILFVVAFTSMAVYEHYYPPTSEFSGMWFAFAFYPVFYLSDIFGQIIGNALSFYAVFIFAFAILLIVVFGVLKLKIKVFLSIVAVVIIYIVTLQVISLAYPSKVVTQNSDVFALGIEAANTNDINLCSSRIPAGFLSSLESCLQSAAIFSGNIKFCDKIRDKVDCENAVELANNYIEYKCGVNSNRTECLNKSCTSKMAKLFPEVQRCVIDEAKISGDKKWCDLLGKGLNKEFHQKDCLNFVKPNLPVTTNADTQQSTTIKQTTVEDYYYSLPSKYLGMDIGDSKTKRKDSTTTLDLKNDYIKINNRSWDGGGAMAVFRTTNGDDLIAISNAGCGPLCNQNFYLLRYKGGTWTDVTAKMLPSIEEDTAKEKLITYLKETGTSNENKEDLDFAPMIEIPQFGTTMKYFDQYSNTVIYEIKWRKGNFSLQECNSTTYKCGSI